MNWKGKQMNDPLWDLYLRAPWYWQLFLPGLLLLHTLLTIYHDWTGQVHILGS